MLRLRRTTQFKRDLKKTFKNPTKSIEELKGIIATLQHEQPLPEYNRDHLLSGNWKSHRECHIQPDFLLIYRIEKGYLVLVRCGSHAVLFG